MLPSNSKPISILAPKTTDADVSVIKADASEATPAKVTITRMHAELRVATQAWQIPKDIRKLKVVSKGTRLVYLGPTGIVFRQGHMISAKGIMEVRPNVSCDILVRSLTNTSVHKPKQMLLSAFTDSMV